MSVKVIIGNLPAGTTAEDLQAELLERKWPLLSLEQVEEGSPDRLTFVAEVDVEPKTARIMADQAQARFFKGRKVRVYVPMTG